MELSLAEADLNVSQRAFLRSKGWATLLAGGYGAGKTTALALKTLQLVSANPGAPGLLIAPTRGALKATTWGAVRRVLTRCLPRGLVPKWQDPGEESFVDFPNGARVYLRSAVNVASYEGLDVAWLCGDEVRLWNRDAYEVAIARARVRCPWPGRYFASTPSMGLLDEEFNQGRAGRSLIVSPTTENAAHLQDGYIDNLRLSYSPRLQAAIVDGEFCILEGAVFEDFSPRIDGPNVIDYDADKHAHVKTYLAVDPGYRRSSWLFIRELGPLRWVVFEQMHPDNLPVNDCVARVNALCAARRWSIDEVWCDPAADAHDQIDGTTILMALQQVKFRARPRIGRPSDRYRSIPWGVEKVRVMLGNANAGLPHRLMFARNLVAGEQGKPRGIVKALTSYAYPEVKQGRPVSDLPVKDGVYDHAVDALRYWCVGRWLQEPALRKLDIYIDAKPGYTM